MNHNISTLPISILRWNSYQYTSNITNLDNIIYTQTKYEANHSQQLDIINTNLKTVEQEDLSIISDI